MKFFLYVKAGFLDEILYNSLKFTLYIVKNDHHWSFCLILSGFSSEYKECKSDINHHKNPDIHVYFPNMILNI